LSPGDSEGECNDEACNAASGSAFKSNCNIGDWPQFASINVSEEDFTNAFSDNEREVKRDQSPVSDHSKKPDFNIQNYLFTTEFIEIRQRNMGKDISLTKKVISPSKSEDDTFSDEDFERAKPKPKPKPNNSGTVPNKEDGNNDDTSIVTCKVANLCEYKCKQCPKTFKSWNDFSEHLVNIHGGNNRFKPEYLTKVVHHQCNECPKKILCDLSFIAWHIKGCGGHSQWQSYLDDFGSDRTEDKTIPTESMAQTKSPVTVTSMQNGQEAQMENDDLVTEAMKHARKFSGQPKYYKKWSGKETMASTNSPSKLKVTLKRGAKQSNENMPDNKMSDKNNTSEKKNLQEEQLNSDEEDDPLESSYLSNDDNDWEPPKKVGKMSSLKKSDNILLSKKAPKKPKMSSKVMTLSNESYGIPSSKMRTKRTSKMSTRMSVSKTTTEMPPNMTTETSSKTTTEQSSSLMTPKMLATYQGYRIDPTKELNDLNNKDEVPEEVDEDDNIKPGATTGMKFYAANIKTYYQSIIYSIVNLVITCSHIHVLLYVYYILYMCLYII